MVTSVALSTWFNNDDVSFCIHPLLLTIFLSHFMLCNAFLKWCIQISLYMKYWMMWFADVSSIPNSQNNIISKNSGFWTVLVFACGFSFSCWYYWTAYTFYHKRSCIGWVTSYFTRILFLRFRDWGGTWYLCVRLWIFNLHRDVLISIEVVLWGAVKWDSPVCRMETVELSWARRPGLVWTGFGNCNSL